MRHRLRRALGSGGDTAATAGAGAQTGQHQLSSERAPAPLSCALRLAGRRLGPSQQPARRLPASCSSRVRPLLAKANTASTSTKDKQPGERTIPNPRAHSSVFTSASSGFGILCHTRTISIIARTSQIAPANRRWAEGSPLADAVNLRRRRQRRWRRVSRHVQICDFVCYCPQPPPGGHALQIGVPGSGASQPPPWAQPRPRRGRRRGTGRWSFGKDRWPIFRGRRGAGDLAVARLDIERRLANLLGELAGTCKATYR